MSAPPPGRPLRITQLSSWLREGGAERVALNLHRAFADAGHDATLVVGGHSGGRPDAALDEPGAVRLPNADVRTAWARLCLAGRDAARARVGGAAGRAVAGAANALSEPLRTLDRLRGREEFRFGGTRRLLDLADRPPDVVHAHNLHGGYFDLRLLPAISRAVPVCLTLHDSWLLSGHCSYSFECDRWQTGCGSCPHLDTYPAVRRDATRANWRAKADIYRRSRLYVAAPSRWLLDRVARSCLAPAVVEARQIPYGVDLDVFAPPADRAAVRRDLGMPPDAMVLLYAANRLSTNPFKDFATLRESVGRVGGAMPDGAKLIFVALGDAGPDERLGAAEVRFAPYQSDPAAVARYYQAADLFLHAARADNFPNTVLESLACGTPVVATAVGGIPEQVRGTDHPTPTGLVTPPGDILAMSAAIDRLLDDPALRQVMARNARADAVTRFDLRDQRDAYLSWFGEMVGAAPGRGSN